MTRTRNPRLAAWLAISMVASLLVVVPATPAHTTTTDLILSEYVEGSSFNKAVEIYNGTGTAVDLSTYSLDLHSNGAAAPNTSMTLEGTLADGDVLVLAHGSASAAILAEADDTNSTVINFNGDDALILRNNGSVVDAFGQIGTDPGSEWSGGGADDTLRRAETVCAGDTNPDDAFDASVEWVVFGNDTFDGLGAHTVDCDGTSAPNAVINEFSASTTGTDVEYVEIYGSPATDLSSLTILEIEGDGTGAGVVDEVIAVGTTDANGLWLADLTANSLENGTITLLLVHNFTGSAGDDLDTDNDGTLDTAPWDDVVDAVAVTDGDAGDLTYGEPVLSEGFDGISFTPGGASRIPDGTDTDTVDDWVRNDFDLAGIDGITGTPEVGEALNTPGTANEAVEPPPTTTEGVFFSEYIEGSSFNKALEIFNGSGATIDLSEFGVALYSNGADSPSQTTTLSGSLADGDVYVLAHPSADPAILAVADVTNGAVVNFNGDDAVALTRGGELVDVIGQIGVDPGSQWGSGDTSTADNTIRRKADVITGDPDGSDVFDPAVEWDGFPNNTFDGLGSHGDGSAPTPVINEFVANHAGTDTVEYVEIYGPPSTDLSGLTVLEIEGDPGGASSNFGTIDEVIEVGMTDGDGFWLSDVPGNTFENGTITLLLVSGFTGGAGDDLDTDNDGTLDTAPWDDVVDAVAVTDGGAGDLTYGEPVLSPEYDGLPFAPGGASRIPDGTDTDTVDDWVRNDFDLAGIDGFTGTPEVGEALNTPGAPNEAIDAPPPPPLGVCTDEATGIHDVQGPGMESPLVGSTVVVEGIVVGDFQEPNQFDGFHIQDQTPDTDDSTSEGIFVFAPSGPDVAAGDVVRLRGQVSEFNGLTEITLSDPTGDFIECSEGNPLPPPAGITLPVDSLDDFEAYEGMLVTLPQDLTISEYFNFDRFGEIVLTVDRQMQPSAVLDPGTEDAAIADLADLQLRSRIMIDDGRSVQNPDPAIHPNGDPFTLDNLFRGGDTVANMTGVMDFAFGLYRVQPTEWGDYTAVNERPGTPEGVGGTLEVASFNVLNYFTTLTSQGNVCGPDQDQECRGADNPNELERQRAKIVAALDVMESDIVGLIEIENHPGDDPTANLVAALNDAVGAGTYDYIETGAIGTDAIRQALIYKPGAVEPIGGFAVLDSSVDPSFDDDRNRPVLAQTFRELETGGVFTVAVNHLKSKGSDCGGPPDDDPVQGNCNLTRTQAAQAMVNWLAGDPTESGDDDVLIIGDLNAYDKEDPIDAIVGAGYTDLVRQFQGENAYSYVFDGRIGYLDHGLANDALVDDVTGTTVWHINADEADLIDYDTSFKQGAQDAIYAPDPYRSSDHDPVIVGLGVCEDVTAPEISVSVDPDVLWPPNHQYREVNATVEVSDDFDSNPEVELVSVTSDEPDNGFADGNTINDIVIVDDDTFMLRAERSEIGDGREYTITYQATDNCGNTAEGTAVVTVPPSIVYHLLQWLFG